jgi:Proteasome/cyclosome repeat
LIELLLIARSANLNTALHCSPYNNIHTALFHTLTVGIVSSGVRNDADPALALLSEHVEGSNHLMKTAACAGLGISYAGANREDVLELLSPVVANTETADMVEVSANSYC